ncbi:MAG: hypothetical protein EKK54_06970 [Neisseriaceae bacterium]|nr:MAG: hypothetical protein EKK54_06970 [Neisseriaceae bacterium]
MSALQGVLIAFIGIIFFIRIRDSFQFILILGIFLIMLLQLALSLSSYNAAKFLGLFLISSVLLSFDDAFLNDILYAYLKILVVFLALLLFFVLIVPVLPNQIDTWLDRTRYTFGYKNANFIALYAFNSVILSVYLKKWRWLAVSLVLFLIVIKYSGTRSEAMFCGVFVIFYILNFLFRSFGFKIVQVLFCIWLISFILSFLSFILRNYPIVDILLSFRLTTLYILVNDLSTICLFIGGANEFFQADNAIASVLFSYGIVGLVAFLTFSAYRMIIVSQRSTAMFVFVLSSFFVFMVENLFSPFTLWGILIIMQLLKIDQIPNSEMKVLL